MQKPSQEQAIFHFKIINYLKTVQIPLIGDKQEKLENILIDYFKLIQSQNSTGSTLIEPNSLDDVPEANKKLIGAVFSSAFERFKKQQRDKGQDIKIDLSRQFLPAQVSIPSPPASKISLTQAGAAVQSNKAKLQNILGGEKIYRFYEDQIGEKNMAFYQNFIGLVSHDTIKEQINRHAEVLIAYPEMKSIYDQRIAKIEQGLKWGYTLDQSEREMNNFRRLTEEQGQMKKAFEVFTNMVAGKVSGDKGDNQLMLDIFRRRQNPSGQGQGLATQKPPTRQAPSVRGGGFGGGTNGLSRSSSNNTPSASPQPVLKKLSPLQVHAHVNKVIRQANNFSEGRQ